MQFTKAFTLLLLFVLLGVFAAGDAPDADAGILTPRRSLRRERQVQSPGCFFGRCPTPSPSPGQPPPFDFPDGDDEGTPAPSPSPAPGMPPSVVPELPDGGGINMSLILTVLASIAGMVAAYAASKGDEAEEEEEDDNDEIVEKVKQKAAAKK